MSYSLQETWCYDQVAEETGITDPTESPEAFATFYEAWVGSYDKYKAMEARVDDLDGWVKGEQAALAREVNASLREGGSILEQPVPWHRIVIALTMGQVAEIWFMDEADWRTWEDIVREGPVHVRTAVERTGLSEDVVRSLVRRYGATTKRKVEQ